MMMITDVVVAGCWSLRCLDGCLPSDNRWICPAGAQTVTTGMDLNKKHYPSTSRNSDAVGAMDRPWQMTSADIFALIGRWGLQAKSDWWCDAIGLPVLKLRT